MPASPAHNDMPAVHARIEALERQVAELQDVLAIYQLLATYGPSVDGEQAEVAGSLWTEDGVYDTDLDFMDGRNAIGDMVRGERHQGFIGTGSAHVVSMPHVSIRGDHAVATGYSRLYLRDGDGYRVARASANRWDLVRTAEGWQVQYRLTRALDGSPEVREILGRGVRGE